MEHLLPAKQDHPLIRLFDFSLPRQEVDKQRSERLQKLKRSSRLQGFRPGKAPLSIIEQHYGQAVSDEVIEVMAKKLLQDKLKAEQQAIYRPVSYKPSGKTEDLYLFNASYEVFPDFSINFENVGVVKKPVVDIDDTAVDQLIDWMALIYGTLEDTPVIDRGDKVTLSLSIFPTDSFMGTLLQLESYQLVIPLYKPENHKDFSADALIGAKLGEDVQWQYNYAHDFENPLLAGQDVQIKAKVVQVQRHKKLTKELLFEKLKLEQETDEKAREEIKHYINAQVEGRINHLLTKRLQDALWQAHSDIDVPPSMTTEAVLQYVSGIQKQNPDFFSGLEEAQTQILFEKFKKLAQQDSQKKIVWLKVANDIPNEVTNEEIDQYIRDQCEVFDDPKVAYENMKKDQESMARAFDKVQQDKMVRWLVSELNIEDDPQVFTEFVIG